MSCVPVAEPASLQKHCSSYKVLTRSLSSHKDCSLASLTPLCRLFRSHGQWWITCIKPRAGVVSSFCSILFQYSSCTTKHPGCQQLKFLSKSCCFQGLGRRLSNSEDWVQFLAPTWQFTTVFNSSSRGYNTLFQAPWN